MSPSSTTRIDWEDVRQRVAAAYAPEAQDEAAKAEERKRILRQRAKELASDLREPASQGETISVVEFDLAGESYGVELACVKEVSLLKELTPVPGTPAFILGIINLRGEILTVIDLKKFFELPSRGITDLNKIIMLQADGMEVGILADAIIGVRTVRVSALQHSLPTLTGVRADYLRGVTHDHLVVLDAAKLLGSKHILVNEHPEHTTALF